ncbi:hypothetical protein ES703_30620 [subsurface metagenome]
MAEIFEYYNTNDDIEQTAYYRYWKAQTFTPLQAHKITSVKLKLWKKGNPGTVTVSIRNTSAGKPSGGDLCFGTTNGNTLPTGSPYQWREIALGDGYDSGAATMYAIVVRAPSGNYSNQLYWRCDYTSPTYTRGTMVASTDSGSTWGAPIEPTDFMFEEWGDLLPSVLNLYAGGFANAKRLTRMRGW